MRRVRAVTHIEGSLDSSHGLFERPRHFGQESHNADIFGEIIAGFIPADNTQGRISASVTNNTVIAPHFQIQDLSLGDV